MKLKLKVVESRLSRENIYTDWQRTDITNTATHWRMAQWRDMSILRWRDGVKQADIYNWHLENITEDLDWQKSGQSIQGDVVPTAVGVKGENNNRKGRCLTWGRVVTLPPSGRRGHSPLAAEANQPAAMPPPPYWPGPGLWVTQKTSVR